MERPKTRPDANALIEEARSMLPVLRERAPQADAMRRLPDETFADLRRARFLEVFKPRRYGGLELGLEEHAAIAMELARGCSAAGWVFSLINEHNLFVAMFSEAAQDDIWGQGADAPIAASIYVDPSHARATRVPGGYRVGGRFGFASGSDHARWLMVAAILESSAGNGAEPEVDFFLIPRDEFQPVDDWHVLGMRGTGSHSWEATDVFVPEHRGIERSLLFSGSHAVRVHPSFRLAQYGRLSITTFVTSAPIAGIAQAAVDHFAALAKRSARRLNSGRLAESEVAQLTLAESAVEAFSARVLIETGAREQMACVDARLPIPEELQARIARDSAYVGVLARRCVDRLHVGLGSQAIFDGHPVHQAIRDVHTAVAQGGMNWERIGLRFARLAVDLPAAATTVSATVPTYIR